MAVLIQTDTFDRALNSVLQEGRAVLNRIVAHEIAELRSLDQNFLRHALESAVTGTFAEVFQFHEMFNMFEACEKLSIRLLVLAQEAPLENNDTPAAKGHHRKYAKNDDSPDIRLFKHLDDG